MKLLKIAIENQRWDIAAHALVWGLVKVEEKEKEKVGNKDRRGKRKENHDERACIL